MTWKPYSYELQFGRRGNEDPNYRPILKEIIVNNVSLGALVDSGTDATIIDASLAPVLGVNLAEGKKVKLWGAGDKDQEYKIAYLHKVTIEVPGFQETINTKVLFADNLEFEVILGQQDFFHRFYVRFEYHRKKFYLKAAPTEDEHS